MRSPEQLRNEALAERSAKDHARLQALRSRLLRAAIAGAVWATALCAIVGHIGPLALVGVALVAAASSVALEWFRLGSFSGIFIYGIPLIAYDWAFGPAYFFSWLGFLCGGAVLGLWFESSRTMS